MSDAEIDRLVAEKVMGWHIGAWRRMPYWLNNKGMHAYPVAIGEYWQPTADIAQAWQVVERMRALGWSFDMQWQDMHPLGQDVFVAFNSSDTTGYWEHDVPTLAICIAALRALGVEVAA